MARPSKSAGALLMLLLVTAGLFTMHTLGHFSTSETMPVGHLTMAMAEPIGQHPGVGVSTPADDPAMPMGSVALCVAVLCGLIVLAFASIFSRCAGSLGLDIGQLLRGAIDPGRGPPKIPIGLALADLSVLRN